MLEKKLLFQKASNYNNRLITSIDKSILVAKRKACLQPEKTHGYQYLFAVQFFDSYVFRGQINKGYLGGLDKVFKVQDGHHRIRRKIVRQNDGLILILAQG